MPSDTTPPPESALALSDETLDWYRATIKGWVDDGIAGALDYEITGALGYLLGHIDALTAQLADQTERAEAAELALSKAVYTGMRQRTASEARERLLAKSYGEMGVILNAALDMLAEYGEDMAVADQSTFVRWREVAKAVTKVGALSAAQQPEQPGRAAGQPSAGGEVNRA